MTILIDIDNETDPSSRFANQADPSSDRYVNKSIGLIANRRAALPTWKWFDDF